ncbi:hypothetical protein [Microbacterium oleivorans]|uniref:Uncharacterized protein n=1 Tax=Microbacterium oleivorans TaxID=273677 RepID=A0A4R5YG59_9MICO|nr:hypothetical protein [Microbacterium oleivorans]TDL43846.1 hypothetical protein E2R54_11695 [Microbacterium oleivorans]
MSLTDWRRDRLEEAAERGEVVKLTGARSIATPAPVQPHRVNIDETSTDNRYPQTLGQFDEDLEQAVLHGELTLRRARETQHERESHRMYVETKGCGWPAPSDDLRGTVVGFTRNRLDATGPVAIYRVDGAFLRLDVGGMLYIELGEHVGRRGQHAEIIGWCRIDRDEFDRLTGIAEVRASMGWV